MTVLDRFLIRHASGRDAARIAGIHVRSWQAAYRGLVPDEVLDALDPVHRAMVWKGLLGTSEETVLVAMRGSRMAGFCSLVPSRDPDAAAGTGEIASFWVDPPAWGLGAGRALARELVAQARGRRFRRLTLWVLPGNARARCFYEKAGFAPDGAVKQEERQGHAIEVTRYVREL